MCVYVCACVYTSATKCADTRKGPRAHNRFNRLSAGMGASMCTGVYALWLVRLRDRINYEFPICAPANHHHRHHTSAELAQNAYVMYSNMRSDVYNNSLKSCACVVNSHIRCVRALDALRTL